MSNELMTACMRRTAELIMAAKPETTITDTKIKEFVSSAYQTIILRMANQGLDTLRQEVILTVPGGTTALTTETDPAIPGISQVIRIWERGVGGESWTEMRKVIDHLPMNATPASNLIWFEFRDGALRFVGSPASAEIKIHYAPRGADFTAPSDTFGFPDLVNPVAFIAASRALGGNPYYDAEAEKDLYYIASLDAHTKQANPVRLRRRRSGTRRY